MRYNHYGVIGEIDSLPGCSQVAVFHSVFNPTERQKGRGKMAHDARLDQARYLGYNTAMCTVNMDNIAQLKFLKKLGGKMFTRLSQLKQNILSVFL